MTKGITNRFLGVKHQLSRLAILMYNYKFVVLLVYELFFIFVYPLVQTTFYEWLLHPITALVFLYITHLSTKTPLGRRLNWILLGFIILVFGLDYLLYFTAINVAIDPLIFKWTYDIGFVVYFLYITSVLLYHLLTDKEPRIDTLAGAASLFLLIGFTWSYLYMNVSDMMPNAFKVNHEEGTNDFMNYLFYSIGRLDGKMEEPQVIAISSFARSITLLESVLGSLYIAIITARIVGLHLEHKNLTRIRSKD